MNKKHFCWVMTAFMLLSMGACQTTDKEQKNENLTQYVDQRIGTGGHGHVFMGANVPFGLVQLGPTSIPQLWDWTSGYHISDTTCIGFSQTHLSGTGIGDLADITLMPVVGKVTPGRGVKSDPLSGQWSYFSHANEKMYPGYYATHLDRYDIDVELTATSRVALHSYTYPAQQKGAVIIDLVNGTCWDKATACMLQQVDAQQLSGYRYSKGWANNQKLFFTVSFSLPIKTIAYLDAHLKPVLHPATDTTIRYARVDFDTSKKRNLLAKVALSPVSVAHATKNLEEEMPTWNFKAVAQQAKERWNAELNRIQITSTDKSFLRTFYTAMYHSMVAPSVFNDVDGSYRGADDEIYAQADFVNYTTFSLWDTYRAAHPLMTLIHGERVNDMVNTMLHICDQQGKLPVWHLMGCETNCMVGNPAIPVVADAIMKGFTGFDKEKAFQAMKKSAMLDERGLNLLKKHGYIPSDLYNESVATCMEYAIADGSLATVAKKLGKEEDYTYFSERSLSYQKYFDPSTRFMRGRLLDGTFRTPFDPFLATHRDCDYTEGNAWQYTWLVPHDVDGLVKLFGGKSQMISKLDSLFIVDSQLGSEASPDISGLIGQYAHGNEPSHHILYLYTLLDQPWKTAEKVRHVLTHLYHDKPNGLSGNEDVGQMSAWYILSSLGFYQVNPAGGDYIFGSPLMDRAILRVADDKQFTIEVVNNSATNKYIQRITLNDTPYTKAGIDYATIIKGGKLVFFMGDKPTTWIK